MASRELGSQGVSARPLAMLPILPGSIATGSRSDTPPRQALVRLGSDRWRSPGRCGATFVMPRGDPIPTLKQQLGAELARLFVGWNADDVAVLIGTDRPRISELRHGKLDRFSLETLIRYLARLQYRVEISVTRELVARVGLGRTSPPK